MEIQNFLRQQSYKRIADDMDETAIELRPFHEFEAAVKLSRSNDFVRWFCRTFGDSPVYRLTVATYVCKTTCHVSETLWPGDISPH